MSKLAYLCDVCSRAFLTEGEAQLCEKYHAKDRGAPTIKSMSFHHEVYPKNVKGAYGATHRFPGTVTIKFSDEHGDHALYELVQAGTRGV